jgi:hypothetical protein
LHAGFAGLPEQLVALSRWGVGDKECGQQLQITVADYSDLEIALPEYRTGAAKAKSPRAIRPAAAVARNVRRVSGTEFA